MWYFVWIVRLAALTTLLLFVDWHNRWASAVSLTGSLVVFAAVTVYLCLSAFPEKWEEEAIGFAIGLVLGAHLIYLTKASILISLLKPARLFYYANLFLLASAILTWIVNVRTFNPVRTVSAFLVPFGLWALFFFVVLRLL